MHQDFGYTANLVSDATLDLLNQIVTFLNSHLGQRDMKIHRTMPLTRAPEPDDSPERRRRRSLRGRCSRYRHRRIAEHLDAPRTMLQAVHVMNAATTTDTAASTHGSQRVLPQGLR
jgi:hypothetical protein